MKTFYEKQFIKSCSLLKIYNYMNLTFFYSLRDHLKRRFYGIKIYLMRNITILSRLFEEKYLSSARWFIVTRTKMHNLKETNLELGLFHLSNDNINDAIFRFNLVNKFFSAGDSKAQFMLGWCYFIKQDFNQAQQYFGSLNDQAAQEMSILLNSLNSKDQILKIPNNILLQYYDLAPEHVENTIANNEVDVMLQLIKLQKPLFNKLVNNVKILEIGCRTGVFGEILAKNTNVPYMLIGTEISKVLCRIASNRYDKTECYNKVHCSTIEDYLESHNEDFNIVVAVNSISQQHDFTDTLQLLSNKLPNAAIALCFKLNDNINLNLDSSKLSFVYDEGKIDSQIEAVGYKIDVSDIVQTNANARYKIVICTKS